MFCFDIELLDDTPAPSKDGKPIMKEFGYSLESLDKTERAGVIETPVVIDSVGSLHLYIENASGTAPPQRSVYSFLEYS